MCAGTNYFSWRAAASTASNCRMRTSTLRTPRCRLFRRPISRRTTRGSRSTCTPAGGIYLPAPEAQTHFLTDVEALAFVTLAADLGFQRLIDRLTRGTKFQTHDRTDDSHPNHGRRPAARLRPAVDVV